MAQKKSETPQLTLSEIVVEKERLANEQAMLDAQLAAAKESAFTVLQCILDEFNAAFGTKYELTEPSVRSILSGPRKCSQCGQTGHTKKTCPNPTPIPSDAATT